MLDAIRIVQPISQLSQTRLSLRLSAERATDETAIVSTLAIVRFLIMAASQFLLLLLWRRVNFQIGNAELTFESTELLKVDRTDDVYYGELL